MLKKFLILLVFMFSYSQISFAKDIPVQVKTLSKISTSNVHLQEGDSIELVVVNDVTCSNKVLIKAGTKVIGVITSLEYNGFTCQEASIYAENFQTKDTLGNNVKLKGLIFKKGRNHWMLMQFLPVYAFIRGGEAQILPGKDLFTLYLGVNNE